MQGNYIKGIKRYIQTPDFLRIELYDSPENIFERVIYTDENDEFYEDEEKYRTQIEANGLNERVILRNEFIPDGDLRKYFGTADLIVQPYKTATQSGVTQVAFHFEKPMLVTNVGGLGEIVHDHRMGYACEPNAQAIAADILDYFSHNRQAAYTAYLQKEKTKYAWSKMTGAFTKIMKQ